MNRTVEQNRTPVLKTKDLCRVLGEAETANEVLHNLNIEVRRGEFCSIVGPSGSGKSTLMYLLGALDKPTSGSVIIDGQDTSKLKDNALAALRNKKLGFIFQFHYLMPEFTAAENIMMPMFKAGIGRPKAQDRAHELLDRLGIADKAERVPAKLSGGEQQRVAIARALANKPLIVLGDEPTGNLDTHNADNVFDVFRKLVKDDGQTIIVVTHDPSMAARTDRIIRLVDGEVVQDGLVSEISRQGVAEGSDNGR